jgi:predicted nucleotidyltransferase
MSSVRFSGADARDAAVQVARRLASDERVRLIFLYGSAADPTRSEVRDLDLALSCAPLLTMSELLRLQADAVAVAGMPVDLIDLDDAGVVLAWEVAETGRCLFARDPDDEIAFITRARARYWDFKPFLDEQWRLAGERLEERRRGTET